MQVCMCSMPCVLHALLLLNAEAHLHILMHIYMHTYMHLADT